MPHTHRFYIPAELPDSGAIALPPDEAHHAARVVRVRAGDGVELFNGAGRECAGVVHAVGKHEVTVRIVASRVVEPPRARLTLVQAWPNHEKTVETVIRRGVELGVTEFRFFRGGHSERAPKNSDKWPRLAVETCKQCRRSWLPAFQVMGNLEDALEGCGGAKLIAATVRSPVPVARFAREFELALVVGPEGGFTEDEVDVALARGAHPISLGEAILRTEIAAGVAISLIQYERGILGPKDT